MRVESNFLHTSVVGHVLEKISLTRLIVVIDIAIQFLIGTTTNLSGIALTALVALPNSRTQELEADLVGLRLMSKACFDPEAVVKCVLLLECFQYTKYTLLVDSGDHLINKTKDNPHKFYLPILVISNVLR